MVRLFSIPALCGFVLAAVLSPAALSAQESTPESATPTLKRTEAISHEERLIELSKVLAACITWSRCASRPPESFGATA